jgi:hypothetical protein
LQRYCSERRAQSSTSSLAYTSIKSFIDNSIDFLLEERKDSSVFVKPELIEKARRLRKNKDWEIHLGIIRGKRLDKTQARDFNTLLNNRLNGCGLAKSFGVWDSKKLVEQSIGEDSLPPDFEWTVQATTTTNPRILVSKGDRVEAIFFRAPLKSIVDLSRLYSGKGWDLFGANVPRFQKNHELSEEIIKAVNTQPGEF